MPPDRGAAMLGGLLVSSLYHYCHMLCTVAQVIPNIPMLMHPSFHTHTGFRTWQKPSDRDTRHWLSFSSIPNQFTFKTLVYHQGHKRVGSLCASLPTSLPRPHMKVMRLHNKDQMKCHLLLHAHTIAALSQGLLSRHCTRKQL